MMMLSRGMSIGAGLLLAAVMSGCANQPKPLYHWGPYQPQVYEYFKGDGAGEQAQIAALEENIQQARAKGEALPPGYHAHLGLLYSKAGKEDQVKQQFETEKALFPESSSFMDFLLRKFKK
ncbi:MULTISPECIES: DUF4810 domain-containing protein [Vogesella]|uniref:DUF4810 domain-containing protein n=1 Tax=Vogesella indigofera TaxID=45465 RepID=A0A495BGN4_VOGIN|nr:MULTISPECIES: DUF4810 domain-containing protein [Vogesella]MCQ4144001.1 DUF4810 domain-containing protein [Vogesella sp. AC12]RKQ59981.1 hypothetical protein C8E02_1323 [Vogesella indigofera]